MHHGLMHQSLGAHSRALTESERVPALMSFLRQGDYKLGAVRYYGLAGPRGVRAHWAVTASGATAPSHAGGRLADSPWAVVATSAPLQAAPMAATVPATGGLPSSSRVES